MTNYNHGQQAEDAAVRYLEEKGFEIIVRNWRTRFCEIDIIARKGRVMYFVEVKYRKTDKQGTGLEYITPRKQKQMEFAAKMWLDQEDLDEDYRLSAIEVAGSSYIISEFLPEI